MRLMPSPHEVVHALDHPPGALGLLSDACHGLVHQRERLGSGHGLGVVEQIERAGGVTGDGRQRLVQLVAQQRRHLAHAGQPGGGLQALLLLAQQVFGATLRRQLQHRAHPAGVPAGAVHQRSLVNHDRKVLAVAALEQRLMALATSACTELVALQRSQAQGLAALVGIDLLRRPIGRLHGCQQLIGRPAHHRAERRVGIDDAPGQVARPHAGEQRIAHRLAKRQRLGQQHLGPRPTPAVAQQQHHHREQAHRQAQHQGGGQVGDQAGRTLHCVNPHLQRGTGQVHHPVSDVDTAAAHCSAARQPGAVSLDERQLMAQADLGHPGFLQQQRQQDTGHCETHQLAGLLHRQANIDHLHPQPAGQRHKLAAREHRRHQSPRRRTGGLGLEIGVGARPACEQRLTQRRIHRRQDLGGPAAALDPAQLGQAAQQRVGITGPGLRLSVTRLQALQALQRQLGAPPDLAHRSDRGLLTALLGPGGLKAQGQHDQRTLRDHQQRDQRHPQPDTRPAHVRVSVRTRTDSGTGTRTGTQAQRQAGGDGRNGLSGVHLAAQYSVLAGSGGYAVPRMPKAGEWPHTSGRRHHAPV